MSDFYQEITPTESRSHRPGQIFRVPAPMINNRPIGLRIGHMKAGQDIKDMPFKAEVLGPRDMGKATEAEKVQFYKRMPLPEIDLASNEDLILQKVKLRPAVLLFMDGVNYRRLAEFESGGRKKRPNPNHYVFAPIYSLKKDGDSGTDYPEEFIEALKEGDSYPHLIHLPPFGRHLPNESMAVLSDPFGVGINCLIETQLVIQPLSLAVIMQQFFESVAAELLPD